MARGPGRSRKTIICFDLKASYSNILSLLSFPHCQSYELPDRFLRCSCLVKLNSTNFGSNEQVWSNQFVNWQWRGASCLKIVNSSCLIEVGVVQNLWEVDEGNWWSRTDRWADWDIFHCVGDAKRIIMRSWGYGMLWICEYIPSVLCLSFLLCLDKDILARL